MGVHRLARRGPRRGDVARALAVHVREARTGPGARFQQREDHGLVIRPRRVVQRALLARRQRIHVGAPGHQRPDGVRVACHVERLDVGAVELKRQRQVHGQRRLHGERPL